MFAAVNAVDDILETQDFLTSMTLMLYCHKACQWQKSLEIFPY